VIVHSDDATTRDLEARDEEFLKADGVEAVQTAVRAPIQNTCAKRWRQGITRECLDWFIVFGEKHL
jgi:hypothetical protein